MKNILVKFTMLLALLAQSAFSQTTYVWTNLVAGVATGGWDNTLNWSPNGLPKTGDTANFSTLDITAAATISLNGNQTNANLVFGDVTASSDWIVDATGGLTLESAVGSPTISVTNRTATIQAVIAGTQGFTKLGGGTLVLSGANTYSGVTTQSVGTLTIAVAGVGTSGAPTSGAFGTGTVSLEGGTLNVAVGGGAVYNNLSVPTGKTIAMGTTVANQLALAGSISGGGTINESGTATAGTHLSGDNSGFTGIFTSANNSSHRVRFDNANAGSAGAAWVMNNAATDGNGLVIGNGNTIYFGSLAGSGVFRSDVGNNTTVYMNIGALNTDSTWTGNIQANGTAVIAVNKVGNGTLVFSGNNTYNGFTTISNGVLQLGAAGGAGNIGSTLVTNYSKLVFSYNRADTFAFPALLITGTGSLSFTNIGAGIMTLNGTNSESGDTTIAAGSIRLLNPLAIPGGPGLGNVIVNGTLDVNSNSIVINGLSGSGTVDNITNAAVVTLTVGSNDVTSAFSGIIKNTGAALSLVKAGAGKITLSGPNTYTGTTAVNGGELDIVTAQTGGGAITVSSGNTFGVVVNNASSVPTSTLIASNASTLNFSGVSSTTIALLNATNLAPDGVVTVNVAGSFVSGSQYPLIKFSNYTGTGGFALGTLPAGTTANLVTNGGFIKLNVTAATPLVWKGNLSPNWDIATTANWTQGASATTYSDGQTVQFNDTAITGNVNLSANVTPAGMLVTNNSLAYTFSSVSGSALIGTAGLTKQGGGTLTLSGLTNTYSGITTISGGTVAISADNNLGNNGGIVLNGGTLSVVSNVTLNASRSVSVGPASGSGTGTFDATASQTLTFNGVIANNLSGTGSLTKTGNGTLILGGANTYSGSTLVSGGKLSLTAAQQGGGSITVNDGTTLSVSRTGGTTLPTASLTLGSGGATTLQLGSLSTGSAVITATNLTTSGTVTISILTGVPALGEVPLIKYTTLGGAGFNAFSLASLPAGVTAVLTNDTANKVVGLLVANVVALTWTGTNGPTWDIGITTNWQYLGADVTFQAGSAVVLDDTAFTNQLNLTTTTGVFTMLVTNNTLNYTLNGNGSLSGPMTLTKTGNGTLIKANLGSDSYTGGTVVQQGVLDVRGNNVLSSGTVILAGGTLANRGAVAVALPNAIVAQTNTTSTLQTAGTADFDVANITGSGNLLAVNTGGGSSRVGLNGDNSGFTGTMTVNNAANMRFAFLTPSAGSANANWVLNSVGVDNQKFTFGTGTVSFGSLSGAGQLRNDGGNSTVTLKVGALNLDSTFTGLIVANGTAQFALTKVGTGTFALVGNQTFGGLTEVANGTLLISTAQTTAKNYVVDDGATLGFNNVGGQALLASLTVGTNLGASFLFTNVSDTATAPAYVSGAGGLTNNGTCTIKLADTNNLVVGNSYPLVQYSAYSGSGSFVLSPPAGFTGTVTNDTSVSQVILIVLASSVNTNPTNLTSVVNNGNLELSWPADHTGWHLQAQTNSLTTGLGTNWVTIPGTDLGNSYTNAINPANGTVFYRMVYP